MLTGDFFKKIIITKDAPVPYYNDKGVLVMRVYDFLLDEGSLNDCDVNWVEHCLFNSIYVKRSSIVDFL